MKSSALGAVLVTALIITSLIYDLVLNDIFNAIYTMAWAILVMVITIEQKKEGK
jgi:hypothetical protein